MTPQVIRRVSEMQAWSREQQRQGVTIGLVPTMGCLHDGHLSLIREARKHVDKVVVSIYVNPTQFGPGEDLEAYPRTWKEDQAACEREMVDVIFFPDHHDMYADNASTWVVEETLTKPLCGTRRPTHFRGVTTIVTKLFNAVLPHVAVFGQKDAQQALVIQRMVRDLNMPVEVIISPIVREQDGLAMSSRNRYLTVDERKEATAIYRGLQEARSLYRNGERDTEVLVGAVKKSIEGTSGKVDYIEIRELESLTMVPYVTRPCLLAAAVYFGQARLLDNTVLK